MRVIAGSAGGRKLVAPKGQATRPTGDRVKEAMFSSLGSSVEGAQVLDLYAGSGALGIEALSRGAAAAVFVERDRRTAAVIQRNLAALGLEGGAVVVQDAEGFCAGPLDDSFDLVLADPPYEAPAEAVAAALGKLASAGALNEGAVVVVERRAGGAELPAPAGLAWERVRSYGDTLLWWGRMEEGDR